VELENKFAAFKKKNVRASTADAVMAVKRFVRWQNDYAQWAKPDTVGDAELEREEAVGRAFYFGAACIAAEGFSVADKDTGQFMFNVLGAALNVLGTGWDSAEREIMRC